MGGWVISAVATTVFMSLYDTEDFRVRMNMKIAPNKINMYKIIRNKLSPVQSKLKEA